MAFDLDGTLADTADLATGRRRPSMVLDVCRADQNPTQLEFSSEVSRLPARVMAKGALVAVVTRSPYAYATTLCYLLGVDYNALFSSSDANTVEEKLTSIIDGAGVEPHELLYVGDRDADQQAAAAVGASYLYPPWLNGDATDTGDIEALATRTTLTSDRGHPAYHKGSLLLGLRWAAKTGRSISNNTFDAFVDADIDDELRSAIAWMLLRSAPAQAKRTDLQRIAFDAAPDTGYDCVIPRRLNYGLACPSRAVMRRHEYETVPAKRNLYFDLLGRLHPAWRIQNSQMTYDHPKVPVYSFRRFNDQRGGELLRTAKNWGGSGKGQAGPEVVLSLIELPTVVVAARLAEAEDPVPIVPVPASTWTKSKPGQVSQRIAIDAAVLAGRDYLDVLTKTDNGIECTTRGNGRTVTVVDDQLTYGYSISESVTALKSAGFSVRGVITWSASRRHWNGAPYVITKCWLADAGWLLGRGGACGPQHRVEPTAYAREVAEYLDTIIV